MGLSPQIESRELVYMQEISERDDGCGPNGRLSIDTSARGERTEGETQSNVFGKQFTVQIYGFKCLSTMIVVTKMGTAEQVDRPLKLLLRGIALLIGAVGVSLYAQRPDVVVMKNGDRFSCTVSKLEQGLLYIEADYFSGNLALDWAQVEKVESPSVFQITLDDGTRSLGGIERTASGETGQEFIIKTNGVEKRTNPAAVVGIESKKASVWRQLTGGLDVGYDFTSGNNQASLNTNANVKYETTRWTAGITDTTSFSGQTESTRTNLIDLQGQEGIFFKQNWNVMGLQDFLHSSQQGLDLRTTLGGGVGRYLFRTNSTFLALIGGAVYTHENFTPSIRLDSDQNIEGLAGIEYQLLRFNRYSLMSQALVFPGFSDLGRIRATPKLTFNMKLENNFYTNLSFWDNYDSHPPPNSKGNEFGISSGVGWTF